MKDTTYASTTLTKTGLPDEGTFVAKAELASIGDQHPYFSITGDLRENGRWVSGGCMHDEVLEYFPALAPYVRWHLTSTDGPMHYLANAQYHAGFCEGMEDKRNIEHLKSTIVYGAVASDSDVNLETLTADELDAFLVARFPALMRQFQEDMNTLFENPILWSSDSPLPAIVGEKTRIKTSIEMPIRKPRKTQEQRTAELRQEVIDAYDKKARAETIERDGKLWLIDHGIKIDNVIYYTHRDMWTFGWRELLTFEQQSAIRDVISGFPFEYELKTKDLGVLSGRE